MKRNPLILIAVLALAATICSAQPATLMTSGKTYNATLGSSGGSAVVLDGQTLRGDFVNANPTTAPTTEPTTPPTPPPTPKRPSTSTTGYIPGTVLKSAGDLTVKAGQKIEAMSVKGMITATAGNSVIRNCKIDATGENYGVMTLGAKGPVLVEDCLIFGMKSAGVYGDNVKVVRCTIIKSRGDGVKAGNNVEVLGNYIGSLGMSDGSHADGVQIRGGDNITIVGNYFDMPKDVPGTSTNANVFLQLDARNVLIQGNWCRGGNYTICAYPDAKAKANVQILGNTFYAGSPRYGFGNIFDGVIWGKDNKTSTGATATPAMK